MADSPDNLVLALLRKLDAKVDRLGEDMREVKTRLGLLEGQYASLSGQYASLSVRLDRLDERVARIERRLELADA